MIFIRQVVIKSIFVISVLMVMICSSVYGNDLMDDSTAIYSQRGKLISYKFLKTIKKNQIFDYVTNPPFFKFYPGINFDKFHSFYDSKEVKKVISYDINVYKIVYQTIDGTGQPVIASGAVLIPAGVDKPLSLLSLQRGTIYYDLDAPSHGEMYCWGIWRGLIPASCGYITIMSDYIGFGESKQLLHPYLIKKTAATDVVDAIRAANKFLDKIKIKTNRKLFLAGLSQGGYNTLAAQQEIETHHGDEFNLMASAPAAGPYSVLNVLTFLLNQETLIGPQATTIVLMAYNHVYQWKRSLTDFFISPYAEKIEELHNGNHDGAYIVNNLPTGTIDKLYSQNFINNFRGKGETKLKNALLENDVVLDWTPRTPTTLYNGTADIHVNFIIAQNAYEYFKSRGGNVRLIGIQGADHFASIIPITLDTIKWFNGFEQ